MKKRKNEEKRVGDFSSKLSTEGCDMKNVIILSGGIRWLFSGT